MAVPFSFAPKKGHGKKSVYHKRHSDHSGRPLKENACPCVRRGYQNRFCECIIKTFPKPLWQASTGYDFSPVAAMRVLLRGQRKKSTGYPFP